MLLLVQSSILLLASIAALLFIIIPLLMKNIKSDNRYDYLDVYIKQGLSYKSVKVRQDLKSDIYEISKIGLGITNNPKDDWSKLSDLDSLEIKRQIEKKHEAIYLTLTNSSL